MSTLLLSLARVGACESALNWCTANNPKGLYDAIVRCRRIDWALWVLRHLDHPVSDRDLRLFALWCIRNTPMIDGGCTGDLVKDDRLQNALAFAERYANGTETAIELSNQWYRAWEVMGDLKYPSQIRTISEACASTCLHSAREAAYVVAISAIRATGGMPQSLPGSAACLALHTEFLRLHGHAIKVACEAFDTHPTTA